MGKTADEVVISNDDIDTEAAMHTIAYVKDLLNTELPLQFRDVNKRTIQTMAVNIVLESLRLHGAQGRNMMEHAIPLVLEQSFLDESCAGKVYGKARDAPELKLNMEALQSGLDPVEAITALGGQHRFRALQLYREENETRLGLERDTLAKMKKMSESDLEG